MLTSDKYFFFYKHRLSQWHMVDFHDDNGIVYNCCEQFMMAQKALLFGDKDTYTKIMKSQNPAEQQKLGREVKNFDPKLWDKYKYKIVLNGNMLRFTQSKECFELLKETFPKILVESSPIDFVWGCGLSGNDPLILDEKNWKGQNLLGKVLTEVRDKLLNDN